MKRVWLIILCFSAIPLATALAEDDFSQLQQKKGIIHGTLLQKRSGSGCSYCHPTKGGFADGSDREEWQCLICHSAKNDSVVEDKERVKRRPDIRQQKLAKTDILSEFRKPFVHPALSVSGAHKVRETLPERDPKAPRHAECVDCHDPHEVSQWNKIGPKRVTGALGEAKRNKKLKDMIPEETISDYELCFNCHSDSENLPLNQTNKRVEFNVNNPSYHPVLAEGKNTAVPSLRSPYAAQKRRPLDVSIISCRDCHGNDDEKGPKGPHGSIYPRILVRNFSINDGQPESSFQYALCYMCHDRDSILRNDSFRYHSIHIQGNPNTGSRGTSCYTCHNSHGSTDTKFMIKFNKDVVFPNRSSGQLRFASTGSFSGECYLSCHDVSHNPKKY